MSEGTEKGEAVVEEAAIIDSSQLTKQEMDTLKADNVGESLYSGTWILSTLLSLSKVQQRDSWNEKMENDLCTLWDMTADRDIVQYLIAHDFFKVAEFSLKSSEEPRLLEIIVGIIGNLACEPDVLEKLANERELVDLILRLLSSEDSGTLVQVLRLLHSAVWSIQNNPESNWRRILKDSRIPGVTLPFILRSSTNQDLLISTINLLRTSAEISQPTESSNILLEDIEASLIIPDLVDAIEEVLNQEEDMYSINIVNFLKDWLELVSGITDNQESLQDEIVNRMFEILRRILVDFQDPWNLLPLDEIKASCIHCCSEIIVRFRWRSNVQEDVLFEADRAIVSIIYKLKTAIEKEESDPEDTMKELLKYLEGYLTEISRVSTVEEILKILVTADKDALEHSLDLLKSRIPDDKLDSVIQALP